MIKIRKYRKSDFKQLCIVMDRARIQELKTANLEKVFLSLNEAPYLSYFLECDIYVATKEEKVVGFVGLKPHKLNFLYVDPFFQRCGIGNQLMEKAMKCLEKPIKLEVFTNNLKAKTLYEKYGFRVIKTVVEKWSDKYPVEFSQDTMEVK